VAEAWVDGHVHAFAFFGAVPQSIVYDNDRCLVAKILPDGTRKRATLFSGFLSHYLIRDRYGRPGKGNDKGNVEGLVGYGWAFGPVLRAAAPLPPRAALLHAFDDIPKDQAVLVIERFQITVHDEQMLVIAIFVRLLPDKACDRYLKVIGELSDKFNRRICGGAFLKLPDMRLRRADGVSHCLKRLLLCRAKVLQPHRQRHVHDLPRHNLT